MANTTGTVIPALSQNDTNTNPHNPMYAIWQYGARGGLLDLIGSRQLACRAAIPWRRMTMMIPSARAGQDLELAATARVWSAPAS